jgi:phenylalanyl-tRNA synthetase alpha chain
VAIKSEHVQRALNLRDLSNPADGKHAMQSIVASLVDSLSQAWACPAVVHRASPIVSVVDNYERLRYPTDAAARDARYTRYLSESTLLRTHTSAMIPPLLDQLAIDPPVDQILLAPVGLVYRRDVIDRLHVGEPHQIDLWRISRRRLDEADLERMIALVVRVLAPGAKCHTTPAEHPYTLLGREINVDVGHGWVEIGECGLTHPEVLRSSGIDPQQWSGLAMGIGLDRAVMLRKGMDDIRLLRSDDPRVRVQMTDLSAYRPVSSMPAIRRDMSIAVAPGTDAETLGDRVRDVLGERAAAIEDLAILSETPMHDLPQPAADRLGIQPGQTNLLVRLVLRHPTHTLTNAAANLLRDEIYAALHAGTVHQWCAPG